MRFSAYFADHERPKRIADYAFYGLAGDVIRTIEPHTEADPAAQLVPLLAAFGSVAGRGPHYRVEADEHYLNLYVALVGDTTKAREGTSLGHIKKLVKAVDPDWARRLI